MKKIKNLLVIIICIAAAVFVIVSMINDGCEHIEDTNGPDDYSLQTITDENICKLDMSSMGITESTSTFSVGTKYSSSKFSGVYELYNTNYIFSSDATISIYDLSVTKGNFKLVVVVDDEIVHEFSLTEPNQEYIVRDVKGNVSVRVAGECAAFKFRLDVS